MRPNKRVQRTRSSASPPHSPLTRGPLGGWGRLLLLVPGVFAVILFPACQSIGGHWYFLTKKYATRVECAASKADTAAQIKVAVCDQDGGYLPAADFSLTGGVVCETRDYQTDWRGVYTADVEPGPWEVAVHFVPFARGSTSLDVRPGEVCTVTFFLTVNTQDSLMVY